MGHETDTEKTRWCTLMRKVIQIIESYIDDSEVVALCNDGSMFEYKHRDDINQMGWVSLPEIPQPEPKLGPGEKVVPKQESFLKMWHKLGVETFKYRGPTKFEIEHGLRYPPGAGDGNFGQAGDNTTGGAMGGNVRTKDSGRFEKNLMGLVYTVDEVLAKDDLRSRVKKAMSEFVTDAIS